MAPLRPDSRARILSIKKLPADERAETEEEIARLRAIEEAASPQEAAEFQKRIANTAATMTAASLNRA
ncbi:hypothetical protein COS86_04250, partial [Candidatus Bathyarchaeota archaeon CG07_land_8_20_14_0_80_47_9]